MGLINSDMQRASEVERWAALSEEERHDARKAEQHSFHVFKRRQEAIMEAQRRKAATRARRRSIAPKKKDLAKTIQGIQIRIAELDKKDKGGLAVKKLRQTMDKLKEQLRAEEEAKRQKEEP